MEMTGNRRQAALRSADAPMEEGSDAGCSNKTASSVDLLPASGMSAHLFRKWERRRGRDRRLGKANVSQGHFSDSIQFSRDGEHDTFADFIRRRGISRRLSALSC